MSGAAAALSGAVIGGALALVGGLLLQWRSERRRMLGAARVVLHELRRNAEAVEWFFSRTGSTLPPSLVSVALQIETRGWDTHNAELSHLVTDTLLNDLERTYFHLRRTTREAPSVAPDWATSLRAAEASLADQARRTRLDRYLWRL